MSRPDRVSRIGVDFAPPALQRRRPRGVIAVVLVLVLLAVLLVGVTQLLLR